MSRVCCWPVVLVALTCLAACSDDPVNSPPQVEIVYPDNGHHAASAPDSLVVRATDDRGIAKVDFWVDGKLLSTVTKAPYRTLLPLGTYADGQPVDLSTRATDTDGARSGTARISITIDPSLQTVPQITTFDFDADQADNLRLSWLSFPGQVQRYEWEVARDDGFAELALAGDTTDTTLVVAVVAEGVAYARVRAVVADEDTGWSRTARFNQLQTWREVYPHPERQLGTGIFQADDGTLRIISHAVIRHWVSRAPVQLFALDADHQLAAIHDILSDDYLPTDVAQDPDGSLRLAGLRGGYEGFVAAVDLDGALRWVQPSNFMQCTALLREADGTWYTVGADLREGSDGGVFGVIGADGAVTAGPTFVLEPGRTVLEAWSRPGGGHVLAGALPDEEETGLPGGIWARGLAADRTELWSVRLGTADNWLLRGAGTDGQGRFLLGGIAYRASSLARYGFVVNIDQDGHLRWQVTDGQWHLFADAQPDAGGRWVVAGVRLRSTGELAWDYDVALCGFTDAGEILWREQHRAGLQSQGWSLAPNPSGGWWAAGTRTSNNIEYDLDLLRVDDRGALE